MLVVCSLQAFNKLILTGMREKLSGPPIFELSYKMRV